MALIDGGIPLSTVQQFQKKFVGEDRNILAQNACAKAQLKDVLTSRAVKNNTQHVFNNKIDKEVKPVTNQEASGRCWIFACLNCMRVPFVKKFQIEEFEFSQTYVFFWDKLERANYHLNVFVECAKKGETYDGRLISHLLRNPSEDGGQWDMLVNVIEKYGVVPKALFQESSSSNSTRLLCNLMNKKLREACMILYNMVQKKSSDAEIEAEKTRILEEIYRLLCITLGTPPDTITYQYYSKKDKEEFQEIGPVSPRDFYILYIKPEYNVEDYVCIVNDPRNPYDKLYTVQYLGNMTGGRDVLYINKPVEALKKLATETIADHKKPVWFGCDVGQSFQRELALQDLTILDTKVSLGWSPSTLDKADRLRYGESLMTHAMTLTGVHTESKNVARNSSKWRVENSWGTSGTTNNGYLTMSDDWFSEYVYEVVIHKSLLDEQTLAVLDQEPTQLPAWDPMGALAK